MNDEAPNNIARLYYDSQILGDLNACSFTNSRQAHKVFHFNQFVPHNALSKNCTVLSLLINDFQNGIVNLKGASCNGLWDQRKKFHRALNFFT